jgi:hypothetical protein
MKYFIVTVFILILAANGFTQLSKKEERTFRNAERLYNKKKEFKAIVKLQPILNKHKSDCRLWSAMIKFHLSRYMTFLDDDQKDPFTDQTVRTENVIIVDSTLSDQLDRILGVLIRTAFYEDLVQLLEDADKNCESIENIREYIDQMKWLGQEKITEEEKITTLFKMHQEVINNVEKNKCR